MRFFGAIEWAIGLCRRPRVQSLDNSNLLGDTGLGDESRPGKSEKTRRIINRAARLVPLLVSSAFSVTPCLRREDWSYAPAITIGIVGVWLPPSGSMVTANILGAAFSMLGIMIEAFPCASGLKVPNGIGAEPLAGINHN